MDFTALIDAPTDLDAGDQVTKRIQIAEIGKFKDPRYGTFEITATDVDNWRRLLAGHFQGEVPIDFDHNTDKAGPTGSKAAAWIKSIEQDGTKVMAQVDFTPAGADSVRNREYRYISPTFVGDLKDKLQKSLGPALLRAALTNNPFLRDMPAIALSGETLAERVGGPSDSRPAMPDLKKILEAAGLDPEADEATLLDAAGQLKAKADKEPDQPKTLEVQAAEAGKVLLDKKTFDEQTAKAGKADKLEERLTSLESERADEKFEAAFTTCLDGGQVDAKPETKTEWRELYDAAPDVTVKRLAALPKVINVTSTRETSKDVPAGGDTDSFELHAAAEAYAAEHKVPYEVATIKVLEQQEVAA